MWRNHLWGEQTWEGEKHRWIWLSEHLGCAVLAANKFPFCLKSWSGAVPTLLYSHTLQAWCTYSSKTMANPRGRRQRAAHTLPQSKRGYPNAYHSLHTLWPSSKRAARFMLASPLTSLVVVWNKLLLFFLNLILVKLWVSEMMLYEWILYMNWIYVIWVTKGWKTDGVWVHEIVSSSKSSLFETALPPAAGLTCSR